MRKIKRTVSILICFVFVVILLEGCNVKEKIFDKSEKVIKKMDEQNTKYRNDLNTLPKAKVYLIQAMEEKFNGKKFKIYFKDDSWISYKNTEDDVSIEAWVEDQDGIVSDAGVDARGKSSLWTDYMSSYYTPIVAKPIEKILNQFDYVENYYIGQDDWDENDNLNNLNWNLKEYFENTGRRYRLGIFLKPNADKETYINEVTKIYDALYDEQKECFDVDFVVSNKLFYEKYNGDDNYSKYLYGYYIYSSYNNLFEEMNKDSAEDIKEDFVPLDQMDSYNTVYFDDYGAVWKNKPQERKQPFDPDAGN
ncbi:MAG: hypothetical protein LBM02_09580 [Lachnospiraceae bacterium]|jgi:hypothetical protein|nr:hypothetical protein [Lachnospiraceae bacterium]